MSELLRHRQYQYAAPGGVIDLIADIGSRKIHYFGYWWVYSITENLVLLASR